ncbi:MAG: major capsid protein [Sphaerochaeta sp.]|jgi:hypothetical protein|nr:major capsid protein [Sphaerochaeta sp.]
MGNPVTSDLHIDAALSTIAVAYKNKSFIADQVFPLVNVDKQSDKYFVWDKGSWLTNQVEKRTPGDSYPEGRIKLSNDNYYADLYHLAYAIPWENKKNQDAAVQLEQTGAEWLAQQFSLNREIQIAAAIFAGAIWDNNPVAGTDFIQWDDFVNSNPPEDIDKYSATIQQNTGVAPNTLVIGRQVYDKVRRHPILLDMFKYTGVGILTEAQVAQALGVEKLLIGRAVQRTSLEGAATAVQAYVWGKAALLLYVPAKPALREPAAGYTFAWDIDGSGFNTAITPWVDEGNDRDVLKGKNAFDFKVVGADLGAYFATVIS